MRRLVVVAGILLAGSLVVGSSAASRGRPTLQLVSRAPVVISGAHFMPRERVRVVPEGGEVLTTRATAAGTFKLTFPGTFVSRCEGFSARATGSRGSVASLKLPRPACMPVGSTS